MMEQTEQTIKPEHISINDVELQSESSFLQSDSEVSTRSDLSTRSSQAGDAEQPLLGQYDSTFYSSVSSINRSRRNIWFPWEEGGEYCRVLTEFKAACNKTRIRCDFEVDQAKKSTLFSAKLKNDVVNHKVVGNLIEECI